MRCYTADYGDSRLLIEIGVAVPTTSLVERKGYGHPDTLADDLAESLSRSYSAYTAQHFGAILHHNFDKLALLGGLSEVRYGGGQMIEPIRVLVNGRAAAKFGDTQIPLQDIILDTVLSFFRKRLPVLGPHDLSIEYNVTSNSSPGAVLVDGHAPERSRWFNPRSTSDLRETSQLLSNDTSLGTGWGPMNSFESLVVDLADRFSGPGEFRDEHRWCGSDVKVMGYSSGETTDLILCVPQLSAAVASREAYQDNRAFCLAEAKRIAESALPDQRVSVRINARDVDEKDELYLTHTGSSIESGDEGVVGRGNRVNGLITPLRPMNVEGANGKNPVYHVGKLYNVVAHRLAQRLAAVTGSYAEVHLISATGQRLERPWRTHIRLEADAIDVSMVESIALEAFDGLPRLTQEIVDVGVRMS